MYAAKTMWSLLWSIPMCAAWVVLYLILVVGWGPKKADKFIVYWNKMIESEEHTLEIG